MRKKVIRKKTSTALVVRKRTTKPALPQALSAVLTDAPMLGALGLVEIKLTKEEEAVLAKPVDPRKVWMKPAVRGGRPIIPYLPHTEYTRWFNEAFGRLGWRQVPCAKPSLTDGLVTCPYLLYIHQKPAAFALGEQEYKNNGNQSYGDAYEATQASALRRLAKHLGMGLELWDRDWLDSNRRQFRSSEETLPADDRPRREERPFVEAFPEDPTPMTTAAVLFEPAGPYATEKQVKRFWAILKNSGRSEATVKTWLEAQFGIQHSNKIPQRFYDSICKAIEAPGTALPLGGNHGR